MAAPGFSRPGTGRTLRVARVKRIDLAWSKSGGAWAVGAFVLLCSAWLWVTPPAGGVDEASHYVRSVGLAHGQLIGDDVDPTRPLGQLEGEQLTRVNAEAGAFRIPGRSPVPSQCNVLDVGRPFDCGQEPARQGTIVEVSLHGRSLPGAYIVPAVFSRFGSGMVSTSMLLRLGMMLQVAVLFAVVVAGLRRLRPASGSSLALLGSTVTPVLVFLAGTLSPSAFETMAVAAFTVALLVFSRTLERTWMWTAVVLAVLASWSRDLGSVATLLAAVSIGIVEPRLRLWWTTAGRSRWVPPVLIGAAAASALAWQAVFKYPLGPSFDSPGRVWADAATTLRTLRNGTGLSGWLDTPMDPVLETLWAGLWLVLFILAIRRLDSVRRWVLAVQSVVLLGISLYLIAMLRTAGFGIQARFLFPLVAVIVISVACAPKSATDSTTTGIDSPVARDRSRAWAAASWAGLLIAGHVSALIVMAHRHARGLNGSPIDFSEAIWSPPGGWAPPIVLTVAGCVCIALAVSAWHSQVRATHI